MEKTNMEVTLCSKDYSEQDYKVAAQAREALESGMQVKWFNDYETFYGVGWLGWVREQLKGLRYELEVLGWRSDMASVILITPKAKRYLIAMQQDELVRIIDEEIARAEEKVQELENEMRCASAAWVGSLMREFDRWGSRLNAYLNIKRLMEDMTEMG